MEYIIKPGSQEAAQNCPSYCSTNCPSNAVCQTQGCSIVFVLVSPCNPKGDANPL
jgi:hypothetical protein